MDDLQKADKVTKGLAKLAKQYADENKGHAAVATHKANNLLSNDSKARLYDILTEA